MQSGSQDGTQSRDSTHRQVHLLEGALQRLPNRGLWGSGTKEETEAGGEGPILKDCTEIPVRNLAGHQ